MKDILFPALTVSFALTLLLGNVSEELFLPPSDKSPTYTKYYPSLSMLSGPKSSTPAPLLLSWPIQTQTHSHVVRSQELNSSPLITILASPNSNTLLEMVLYPLLGPYYLQFPEKLAQSTSTN